MPPVSDFVQRQSSQLLLNGEAFRIVGANIYYFAFSEQADQMRLLDIAEDFGVNVLRIWAFKDHVTAAPNSPLPGDTEVCFQFLAPGASEPELREGAFGLDRLDRAVQLAGERGIRLLLTLTNHNPDYGGMPQYQRWLGFPNLNDFYRDARAKATFENWVKAIVTRQNPLTGRSYAEDPTIFAWEIANEPRCPADPSGTQLLTNWLGEMSAFIRSFAPQQLITAGDEGFFNHHLARDNWLFNGSCGVSAEDILGIREIDLGTFHMYPDQWAPQEDPQSFGEMWIQNHIDAARRASKPVILEEYGIPASTRRNDIYETWLQMIEDQNVAGDLVWMLGLPAEGDQYLLTNSNDAPAIRDHASRYAGTIVSQV
jgi:mannan endo-1,4-beta-mannosidase